jgi:hypothetical protein
VGVQTSCKTIKTPLLCATLNVTSGRAGIKRNEAEKCRMGLQKIEIEVEAPENWGAPR